MIAVSLFLFAYGDGTGQPVLWLSPPTIRILPNATGPGKDNARSVNLAAQLGEAESVQVGLRLTQPTALESITVSPLPPGVSVDIFKVIAVYCNRSAIYGLDGDRWIPDVLYPMSDLIESGAVALEPDIAHSFWIKFTIACNATPGSYNATATLELVGGPPLVMPVAVTIWPLTVPKLESTAAIGTVFSFRTDIMAAHYGNHGIFPAESAMKWFDGLAAQRIPGDTPYIHPISQAVPPTGPIGRDFSTYEMLAKSGTRCLNPSVYFEPCYMNLLDVSHAVGQPDSEGAWSKAQLDGVVTLLAPVVKEMKNRGWFERCYVYGFDERPQTNAWSRAINAMFGFVKQAFPGLRTMSAIRWEGIEGSKASVPGMQNLTESLDIWVSLYSMWNATVADFWRSSGPRKEVWAYHCISPRPAIAKDGRIGPMRWLNSFVESKAMESRLLMWWGAGVDATGWLYWSVNVWDGERASVNLPVPPKQFSVLTPSTTALRAAREKGVVRGGFTMWAGNGTTQTDFSARVYNRVADPLDRAAFGNGDGILVYPGAQGPLSSIRLENIRDGLEDAALLRGLTPSIRTELLARVMEARTGFAPGGAYGINITVDADGLEAIRRNAAKARLARAP